MEPLFANKCTHTKQNINEVTRSTSSRKLPTIISICLGLIIFVCGLLIPNYIYCLFGAFFALIYPLILFWAVRHSATTRYQQLLQLYHGEAESITGFYEDHLIVRYTQGGSDVTVAYPQIAKVYESKNLFFLMLSTRIGFMLEKQGFTGITADEFGGFIRARAVGEGQKDLKKRKRKTALITTAVMVAAIAVGVTIGLFGDAIENLFPKTFTYDDYSIQLTSAFEGYEGEWYNEDATVYCFYETREELRSKGLVYDSAAAYLKDTNESYEIYSDVTTVSDNYAWTSYNETYDGTDYYYYDYVIKSYGVYWYTEFYCLAEDADKYAPLFEKWAQTITVPAPQ